MPVADAVAAIQRATEAGTAEVVLTGVDLASYAFGLGLLVRTVLRDVPALKRLRLSSLDPAALDDAFWDAFATGTGCCRTCICPCRPAPTLC